MPKLMLPLTYDNIPKVVKACEPYIRYFDIDLRYGRHSVDAISYLGVLSFCNHTVQVVPVIAALKDDVDEEKVNWLFKELKQLGAYEEEE